MASRMLTFVDVEREMPDKRNAGARRSDFQEIYGEFAAQRAAQQASRGNPWTDWSSIRKHYARWLSGIDNQLEGKINAFLLLNGHKES